MGSRISLVVLKTGAASGIEISELCQSIVWSGRKGSPTRTLKVTMIDTDNVNAATGGISIEDGYQCIFSYDGEELFRGIFLRQSRSYKLTAEYTAYDLGIYLSNNKDTFVYENTTATAVFKSVCARFGLEVGGADETSYIIPDLTKSKTTGWDTIEDAMSLDYDNTGEKHYVFAERGKLYLRKRSENIIQWVLETGANIADYNYDVSMEEIKTRIKLLSSEDTVVAEKSNAELEAKIGIFQEVDTPDESLTTAQIVELAETMLQEKSTPERTLTLRKVLGKTDIISGVGVYINIPHLGLNRTFYVDQDEHTFEQNWHTMSLTLNLIAE